MKKKHPRMSVKAVRTTPIADQKRLVHLSDLSKVPKSTEIGQLLDSLPPQLKADDFRALLAAMKRARRRKRGILWLLGGHVIKVGCSPILVDLIRRGFVTSVATAGAAAIHDLELAFFGRTSEDVADGIKDGTFGTARETGDIFHRAVSDAAKRDVGLGQALGELILRKAKYARVSVFAAAAKKGIPATIHLAMGGDIVHTHPKADGAKMGLVSFTDFEVLAASIVNLNDGGVVLNWGSAVVLPEVFLKALTVARNVRGEVRGFTAANFDMYQHYRPNTNVVNRPTQDGGTGYTFSGHHEIMLPLLAAALR